MQRNRRELTDVFNRAIPRQPAIEVGNQAHIHAMETGPVQQILDNPALAG